MSIKATCPSCGSSFTLSDSLGGKTVRCKDCHEPFQVEGGVEGPVDQAARADADDDSRRPPPRRRRVDDDDDADRPRRRRPQTDDTGATVLKIFLIIGGVGLVVVLFGCGAVYFFVWRVTKPFVEVVDNMKPMMQQPPQVNPPPGPVYGPQETVKLCVHAADFTTWEPFKEKLKSVADAPNPTMKVDTSGEYKWVTLAPVRGDLDSVARKLSTFGNVGAVHNDQRLIYVDPK